MVTMLLANAHNVTIQHGDAHDGDLWCICIIGPVTFSKFYSFYSSSQPVRSWQSGCDRYIVVLGGADVVLRRFTTAACLRSSYCTCSLNLRRQAWPSYSSLLFTNQLKSKAFNQLKKMSVFDKSISFRLWLLIGVVSSFRTQDTYLYSDHHPLFCTWV